jgi:hypothetical protein
MKIALESPYKGISVPSSGGKINVNETDIGGIITGVLPYIFGAAAILLLIYLVTAGLSMMLSRGEPKTMQAAQAKITNALIGFVIVFFAFSLVLLVGNILGVNVFEDIFKK